MANSFNFKKKFGQNFLQDKNVIYKIVDSIGATKDDLVIEIGPGGGALTKYIKLIGCKYIGYEIDTDVKQYLDTFVSDDFNFIYGDFLDSNIEDDIKNIDYNNLYIVGNLPYYITTPIIIKIISANLKVKNMVFMVQKEVAERFSAKPKTREYGSISVFLNYHFDIKNLFVVPKKCFYPVPGVDSAVVSLSSKENKLDVDFDKFNKLVKDCFQFKRKNLRNNLKMYDKLKIENILNKHGFSLDNRAEDLPYEVFVDIVNNY